MRHGTSESQGDGNMKRRLLLVAVFLLAGAVVNVAVAWGCAAWMDPHLQKADERFGGSWVGGSSLSWIIWEHRTTGAVRIISRWHKAQVVGIDRMFRDGLLVPAWAPFVEPDSEAPPKAFHFWVATARGWPMCSVAGAVHVTRRPGQNGLATDADVLWAIALDEGDVADIRKHWKLRLLPFRPLAVGFTVNTIFYATILWLLISGPFVVRRFIRVRRGLCPACAYPIGQSDACSECGKDLPSPKVTAT